MVLRGILLVPIQITIMENSVGEYHDFEIRWWLRWQQDSFFLPRGHIDILIKSYVNYAVLH